MIHLPPKERACVLLKDIFDYSLEEIADLVESTVGGVKAALNRGRPPLARVAFTFTLSTAARVVVTLARRVRVHERWRWSTLRGSNSIAARAGANHAHISGRGVLPSGVYRLTLTPAHGAPRSLMLTIG